MTREEAKQLLPIIQAFAEGKTIQYRVSPSFPRPNNHDISYVKEWFDIDEDKCDCFSCDGTIDYRIKPEPKYRPFRNVEECWNEMLNHQPFGWLKDRDTGGYIIISELYDEDIEISGNNGWDYVGLMKCYTFADGTPFGIKE